MVLSNPYSLNPSAEGFNVSDNVIITANFAPGLSPTYSINAIASFRGTVAFNYINNVGEEIEFFESGFAPGATVVGIACGHIVTSGDAYITSTSC